MPNMQLQLGLFTIFQLKNTWKFLVALALPPFFIKASEWCLLWQLDNFISQPFISLDNTEIYFLRKQEIQQSDQFYFAFKHKGED